VTVERLNYGHAELQVRLKERPCCNEGKLRSVGTNESRPHTVPTSLLHHLLGVALFEIDHKRAT